jgi:hypothetical protein
MRPHPARDAASRRTEGTGGARTVRDAFVQSAVAIASQALFSRAHCGRYFGGLWFKVFSERGPC